MSANLVIRTIDASEVPAARTLYCHNVDFHARHVVERLPTFFDIARLLEPDNQFAERQRIIVGAFADHDMVGTAAIETTQEIEAPVLDDTHQFWDHFTDHDLDVYCTLSESLDRTYIGAPMSSLAIHSLAVATHHRKRGVARSLLSFAISQLGPSEQSSLYIEVARLKWLVNFGTALGFVPTRKTFSFSERLEYGCWGSVLMRYGTENRG